jgi:hypothetical protein
MFSASLYIISCSARNRLRQRLRRLREPRYLIGALVGVAYLYFSFFARLRMVGAGERRRRAGRTAPPTFVLSAIRTAVPGVLGLGLLVMTALAWLLPTDSGLLDFSDAEIQFLFPAPVTRRSLLIHRLMRSQLGLLFGGVMAGIVMPSISGGSRLRVTVAVWILLTTAKVYFTGITLARARLGAGDAPSRRVAWLPLVTLTAALAIVGEAIAKAFGGTPPASVQDVVIRVGAVTNSGLSSIVLWPFMTLAQPAFAPWPGPYLNALALAGAILALTIVWVLQSDAVFQEAAQDAAARRAEQSPAQSASYSARPVGWRLAPAGRVESAFAWKAALQTVRLVDRRALARIVSLLSLMTIVALAMGHGRGVAATIGALSVLATVFAILLAPQVLRIDMRQDLHHLELLKTWPVRPSAVIRGEVIWPGVMITLFAWLTIALAVGPSAAVLTRIGIAWRAAAATALAVIAPALVFMQLTIHNAAAILFPAWVPVGSQRPRGLDALGQRLIMLAGTWLALIVSALPGVGAGALVWFAFRRPLGPAAVVPAAVVCSVILAVETLLATEALGPVYERLDLTAVERAE